MGSIDRVPGKIHVLCFPFPAKGHINPILHLANRLISKDFKVTLITTTTTMKSVRTKATSFISIESIDEGFDESSLLDPETYFENFRTAASQSLTELVEKLQMSNFPPKILIYDSTMPWVLDIAQGLGLHGASFFTQACAVSAVFYHMLQGTIDGLPKDLVVSLPSMPPLEGKDLPNFEFLKGLDPEKFVTKHLLNQFSNIHKVDYILFNSFDKLENEVVNWMASQWSIKTVGPLAPSLSPDKELKDDKEGGNYLFETNSEACLKWLDERETGSVIYVSMGSVATLGEEQMEELAQGIVRSDWHFLWIVRAEEESKLPENFKSETSEKGLIINWCPQLDVLAHRAVACFMTHCGWNSTLEALISGTPMVAMPQWVDQTTNAKFIADVWQAGVRVKVNEEGVVTREEIERCIREVTQTEKGKEIKNNALKWKNLAKEAVQEGGSSDKNIEEFVSALLRIA